jgi:alkylation response protein AidB-like acyl-CoA dehydrogenase
VDFERSPEQQAIVEAVEALLARRAGPARAIELDAKGGYDDALDAALAEAGFSGAELAREAGALTAALVVEAVARAGGVVAAGAHVLVAPFAVERVLPEPISIARAGADAPVRFGAHARTLLLDAGDEARVVALAAGDAAPVRSNFMVPLGRVRADLAGPDAGVSLGPGSGARLRRWWRVALAAECLGAMQAALAVTVEYVKRRRQFGRAIGSFQALQHRLAECAVRVEATRWLTCEAAARGAGEQASATAAAYAAEAAHRVFRETHQLTGAMGFTREHDLHVWSMRLEALRVEMGGASAHHRAITRARWLERR